jgi:hypothetical protein
MAESVPRRACPTPAVRRAREYLHRVRVPATRGHGSASPGPPPPDRPIKARDHPNGHAASSIVLTRRTRTARYVRWMAPYLERLGSRIIGCYGLARIRAELSDRPATATAPAGGGLCPPAPPFRTVGTSRPAPSAHDRLRAADSPAMRRNCRIEAQTQRRTGIARFADNIHGAAGHSQNRDLRPGRDNAANHRAAQSMPP